jgi:hypothetical protein
MTRPSRGVVENCLSYWKQIMQEKYEKLEEKDKPKLSAKAKENLRKMAEWRREYRSFVTLQPHEKFCKYFDRQKMKPVIREYDGKQVERFQCIVTDLDTGEENYWETSLRMSERINAYLNTGCDLLEIQRFGSGINTRYRIFPQ